MRTQKHRLRLSLVAFAVIFGVLALIAGNVPLVDTLLWLLLFSGCAYATKQTKGIAINTRNVSWFIATSCGGAAFLWLTPWNVLSSWLSNFVSNMVEAEVLAWCVLFVFVICVSGCLFIILAAATRSFPKDLPRFFTLFLARAALAAGMVLVFSVVVFLLRDTLSPFFFKDAVYFFDGLVTQLSYGIVYYYIVVSFMGETHVFGARGAVAQNSGWSFQQHHPCQTNRGKTDGQ